MRISDWSSGVCSSDLEVLAVLAERGGADGLQLTPGQHGLQDGSGIDGALGGPGTHEGVELVDQQDDLAAGADLLEHLLEALLEVAVVAGAVLGRTSCRVRVGQVGSTMGAAGPI